MVIKKVIPYGGFLFVGLNFVDTITVVYITEIICGMNFWPVPTGDTCGLAVSHHYINSRAYFCGSTKTANNNPYRLFRIFGSPSVLHARNICGILS